MSKIDMKPAHGLRPGCAAAAVLQEACAAVVFDY